jgi:CheY-like chemotaxis protein
VGESTIAEFGARISFSGSSDTTERSRVVLRPAGLVLATGGTTRRIPLDRVFDIAQDVSPLVEADATETVTIAFTAESRRQLVSIEGRAETLFRFQHALFGVLLDGTPVAVRHTEGGSRKFERSDLSLRVSATRLRVEDEAGAPVLTVSRDDLTRFRSQSGEGDARPVISLYWRREGRPAMTTARLPSPRLFNLFGRYIQSPLRMVAPDEGTAPSDDHAEVLLVDDEPDALELAEVFLRRQSDRLSVTTTQRPADALEQLERGSFDCIVSDFRMPRTNGIELLQQVRESHPDLPFILFTGQGSEDVAKRAILDDVTDYVEKGVGTDPYVVLADRIDRAVR